MRHWRRSTAAVPPPAMSDELERMSWFKPAAPLEYVVAGHHGGRDRLNWPRIDLHNFGAEPVLSVRVCFYIYDQNGTQLARLQQTVTQRIPPKGKVALELAHPAGARPLGRDAVFEDLAVDRIVVEGVPPAEDKTRCPDKKPYKL